MVSQVYKQTKGSSNNEHLFWHIETEMLTWQDSNFHSLRSQEPCVFKPRGFTSKWYIQLKPYNEYLMNFMNI